MPERTLKRPHRFLSPEEVRRLVAASKEPTRTIILLATMTGLRIVRSSRCARDAWNYFEALCSWQRPTTRVTSVHRRRERAGAKFRWLPRLYVNSRGCTRVQRITRRVPWFLQQPKALRFPRTISERNLCAPHASELVCHELIGIRSVTRMARCCTPKERR